MPVSMSINWHVKGKRKADSGKLISGKLTASFKYLACEVEWVACGFMLSIEHLKFACATCHLSLVFYGWDGWKVQHPAICPVRLIRPRPLLETSLLVTSALCVIAYQDLNDVSAHLPLDPWTLEPFPFWASGLLGTLQTLIWSNDELCRLLLASNWS